MSTVKDESHPLVDISPPVVNAPQAGSFYSPVYVNVTRGEGGHYYAKWFNLHFHPNGPFRDNVPRDDATYSQSLSPGPHQLHARGLWAEGSQSEESDWVFADWFYVLTPPEN